MTEINISTIVADYNARELLGLGEPHWFSPGTMQFFNSRLEPKAYRSDDAANPRAYFVTSEQYDQNSPRRYSVRVYDFAAKKVGTVGEMQAYRTPADADAAAQRMALHSEGGSVGV